MARTAILDIDGTLVDTNYQHAVAWYRAFRQNEIVAVFESIPDLLDGMADTPLG